VKGKWRIVKMPDYTSDFPDMVEPAYTHGGDEADFTARPWRTSSTAC
jgi:hypothetical protein